MFKRSNAFLLTFALLCGIAFTKSTANAGVLKTTNVNAKSNLLNFKQKDVLATSTGVTNAIAKVPGYSNPLITQKFGADPFAMVYNGRVYVYMSSDAFEYNSSGNIIDNDFRNIKTISVISSDDMVNWTDHGEIPVAGQSGAAKWATNSWAPSVAHKVINGKDKFFLYFANNAGSIGVLTADSPVGPWTDPIGKPMITGSTPGVNGVAWLFDPAVLVDDDGTGYLYFGGGIPGGNNPSQSQIANPKTARVIKLDGDMIHTSGSAVAIDSPFMFEDSGIHKYNGKYYYSYCSNFSGIHPNGAPPQGDIAYMTSNSPMGPFTYQGTFLKNPGNYFGVGGNNHHAVFKFNNQWYVVYHAQTLGKAMGVTKGYRSPMINKISYSQNGLMNNVVEDMQGVAQVANLNPYKRTEAETIGWNGGISTEKCTAPGGMVRSNNLDVTSINNGDWLAVSKADFGSGAASFKANVASTVGGQIEIHLDSVDGQLIGTLNVSPTGGQQQWKEMQCNVKSVSGVHNIFFKFTGNSSKNLFNIDYWQFSANSTGNNTGSNTSIGSTVNLNNGWYYIKNVNAQKYLQVAGNTGKAGQNVELRSGSGVAGQKWYLTNVGNGYVTLKSALGEYMLDVSYGEDKDGSNIQIFNAYSGDSQKFSVKASSKVGQYSIATMSSNQTKVLDDYNFGTTDGTNVCQWTYGGNSNQLWVFEPTNN